MTVVTGASEGVGYALAREFAGAGNDLLLVARTRTALEQAAENIRRDFDVAVNILAVDIAGEKGCAAIERAVTDAGQRVHYLVNNAGMGQSGWFAQAPPERLTGVVDLNVRTLTDLVRRFLPGMIEADAGGVLNVASLAGFLPGPYQAVYYASKAYVISLTEALAHETSGTKVRMSALAPGPVKTGFHERMGSENDFYMRFQGVMSAEEVARIGFANFMCGQRIIIPGVINMLTAMSLRFVPHTLLTPFAGWLLQHRDEALDA